MNKQHFDAAVDFGKVLIKTGDLDPVYVAVYRAGFDKNTLARWMLAYSCLYHLAASVYLSQFTGKKFWGLLQEAAVNKDLYWPRGSERRHWRGHTSTQCVAWLRQNYSQPEAVAEDWKGQTCEEVLTRVKRVPYYGPWVAFKVADLMERVLGEKVDFSNFALGVYSEPRKGAALLLCGEAETRITDIELGSVVQELLKALGPLKAPPTGTRRINVQEIETVLCKYKSHVGGHYPPGKDTLEVWHGLQDQKFQCAGVKRMQETVNSLVRQWR